LCILCHVDFVLDDASATHDALPLLEVAADGDANGEEEEGQHDTNYVSYQNNRTLKG
jgi:hypothetical protein